MPRKTQPPAPLVAQRLPHDASFWLATLGFGLYLSWGFTGDSPTLLSEAIAPYTGLTSSSSLLQRAFWIAAIVVAGLLALFRRDSPVPRKALALTAGILATAGTGGIYLLGLVGKDSEPLLLCMQIAASVSSLFVVLWGEYLCMLKGREVLQSIVLAYLVSFLVAPACGLLPSVFQAIFHSVLPLASALLYLGFLQGPRFVAPEARSSTQIRLPLRAYLGIGLYATVIVLLFSFSEGKTDIPNEVLCVVAGLAVTLVLFVVTVALPNELRAATLCRLILPSLVISVFLIFGTDFGQQAIEVLAITAAWAYFRIFTWIIWRIGALHSRLPAITSIALGQVIFTLGTYLGHALHLLSIAGDMPKLGIIASLCVLAIGVSMFLLDTQYVGQLVDAKPLFDPTNPAMCERCIDEATVRYGLSTQERTIALMLVRGDDNQRIFDTLVITASTLRTHLRNIYKKTDTHSREELVVMLRSLV